MARKFYWLLLAAFLWTGHAAAQEAPLVGKDPAVEERMRKLASSLRCLVCQNESLADSNADLAADLRQEIREKMESGMSDAQIRSYLVARYGNFVLYKPPFMASTFFLWAGPFLLLVIGIATLFIMLRRRQKQLPEPEPDAADLALSRSLLNENQDNSKL